jgi:hypothetical protein
MTFEDFLRTRCPDGANGRIFLTKVLIEPDGVYLYFPPEGALSQTSKDPAWMGEVKGDTLIPSIDAGEINPHSVPDGEAA